MVVGRLVVGRLGVVGRRVAEAVRWGCWLGSGERLSAKNLVGGEHEGGSKCRRWVTESEPDV